MALCPACGLVQTVVGPRWQAEAEEIYAAYTIYHQSGGREQPIFAGPAGAAQARSEAIIQALVAHTPMPARGRWLDVGCGNGALLRACGQALPGWTLFGSEVNDKYRGVVEALPGVERLLTGPLAGLPTGFDLISLVHVLEHVPGPQALLRDLAGHLNPGGRLLVEVPDCRQNPFILMVADHCSHFSLGMLRRVVAGAGYKLLHATETWVPKEITLVAQLTPGLSAASEGPCLGESDQVLTGWATLQAIVNQVALLAAQPGFGIFGTSIAATWLDAQTGGRAQFFVDEDPHRVGQEHLGRPILAPATVPAEAKVYLALPPALATRVAQRLRAARPSVELVSP